MNEIPYGYCHCGCGEKTRVVKRKPLRYLQWHHLRTGPDYAPEDRGHDSLCWIWQRSKDRDGYGLVTLVEDGRKTSRGAHRLYYEDHVGAIPEGTEIDHLCAQRGCVNPDHLEPVDHAENMRRGRTTKLALGQVREIRASDQPTRVLAARFRVSYSTIQRIRKGASWASLAEAA